jgi:hypothetical protein
MSRKDYLPSNALEFLNKVHNIRAQVVTNQARWENSRGEKGPWTEIISAIIP